MILPCRIHRARNVTALIRCRSRSCSPLAFLLLIREAISQDAVGSRRKRPGSAGCQLFQFKSQPAWIRATTTTLALQPSGEGSIFTRENVVLTYDRPGERTQFFVMGVGRFSQYFDVSGQNETAGNVTLSLTHNFSSRLSFYASVYGSYQNQPNFQSNVGPQNVVSPFFDTVDIFSLTYHWSSRLSLVTSYTFERVQYFSSSNGNSQNGFQNTSAQNRVQNTFGEAVSI